MRELNSVKMTPGQDPDIFLSRVYQLRDELENAGETVSEERLSDIVMIEGLTSDYDLINYNAECDPDLTVQSIETTISMRNMCAKLLARRVTSGSSHGRDSSLTVASISNSSSKLPKFRGNCHTCGNCGHYMKDFRSRKQSNNGNRRETWCIVFIVLTRTTTPSVEVSSVAER